MDNDNIVLLVIGLIVLAIVVYIVIVLSAIFVGTAVAGGTIYGGGTAIRNYFSSFKENVIDSNFDPTAVAA
jgi:uncharacterized membrane protein